MKNEVKSEPISLCQSAIKNLLHIRYPNIRFTAQLLDTSVRTLQRQLHNNGISYSQLVQETRFKMACDLIETSDKKIQEIASTLGYSDPSSFSRAFRKLAHMSPREYRLKVSY